jgi:nitroimidazol reductase NimA-like FMN-containing flavoprotein (pyridoxamine 5'-phosphate oxidase superfamily)
MDERSEATDLQAVARSIVESNSFMTLATADADGRPWASPVWYAHAEDHREYLWVSSPEATHSRNLSARPEVAIVIFDSHQAGGWNALYLSGTAAQLGDGEEGIELFTRRSLAKGLRAWGPDEVRAPSKHRLYRATIDEAFVLDPHDQRIPVTLA